MTVKESVPKESVFSLGFSETELACYLQTLCTEICKGLWVVFFFLKNNCIHLLLILSLSWYLLCYFNTNQNDSQERLFLQPIIGVPLTSFASFPSCFPDTSLHANLLFGPRFTLVLGNRQQFLFMWTIKGRKNNDNSHR